MSEPMTPERLEQLVELAEMSGPDSAIAHAVAEVERLLAAARRVQCGDCGAVGEVGVAVDGLSYLYPSGQIGHDTAGGDPS